jgi:DNA helicase II / ATP-dependent DNA helicase PcrA
MDKLLEGLNPAQKKAVIHSGSPLLVLAGAGSGKTRVLTHRAAWLVTTGKVMAENLLLLTFTNKAAGEMKDRVSKLLKNNVSGIKKNLLFAGTFHSFCCSVLRRDGRKIGIEPTFVIYDDNDQQSLIKDIVKDLNLDESRFKAPMLKAAIEDAKNNMITASTFADGSSSSWAEVIAKVYLQYEKRLAKTQALDFNDLLFKAVELFKNEKVLEKYQNQYRHILVDEYQDTNRSQYLLTKFLAAKHKNLTVVGDAAQAIYSWRGADYRNLLSLDQDYPDLVKINLEVNYRSTQTILDAANNVISKNERHPILKLVSFGSKGGKIVLFRSNDEIDEAEYIAEKIKSLIDFKGADPTKIAVLYRTNAQSRTFEEVFIRRSIPYILIGGTRFYERAEVKDVLSLLRVFYNFDDWVSWKRIEKNMGKRRSAKVKEFVSDKNNRKLPSKKIMESIVIESGYLEKFDPRDETDSKRLENVRELASVAEKFPDLGDFLENVSLVQQEYFAQEKEKDNWKNQAVKLMTLHASKGLEFETVFLVGMEEGLLPHAQNLDETEKLEEERRLCYVGMTRAKTKLYITLAAQRLYFGKTQYNDPSRFLSDLPKNLLSVEGWTSDEHDDDDDYDSEW